MCTKKIVRADGAGVFFGNVVEENEQSKTVVMTDEEMAEIKAKSYGMDLCCYCRECDKGINNPCEHKKDALHGYKDGFLEGLKAGRPKWHDLLKNPTDVPKENVTVLLLTEVGSVTARYYNKYEAFFRLSDKLDYCIFIAPMSYIAWCEIPKYTEE